MTLQECYAALGGDYNDALGRLRSERLIQKFVLKFLDDGNFELLSASLAAGNIQEAFRAAHTIKGMCQNLSFTALAESDSELTESAAAYCTDQNGNLLGLPFWESSVSGCYYNKTILDSLGLKPASTQAEFDVLCQVLCDAGYTPICWPADGCSWMFQFGLDPLVADHPDVLDQLNRDEITYADIPKVREMTQWISDAAEKGWFGSDYLETGWDRISPMPSSGDAVMTFIWDTWFDTDFLPEQYSVEDFALMPVFLNTADNGTYEGGNLNMMMVNKNSKRMETALDFLSFCAMPEHYNVAFDGISTVSCFNGQTTNIQSRMVTDARASIADYERVSTAATRIVGYSGDDVASVFHSLLRKKITEDECIRQLDEHRREKAGF